MIDSNILDHPAFYPLYEAMDELPKFGSLNIEGVYEDITLACKCGNNDVVALWPWSAHEKIAAIKDYENFLEKLTSSYFAHIEKSIYTIIEENNCGKRQGSHFFQNKFLENERRTFKERMNRSLAAFLKIDKKLNRK